MEPCFQRYQPRSGDPDWAACFAEARELAARIAPLIKKRSDLTLADRRRDALRRAGALRRSVANGVINRSRLRRGDHALRPLYTIWTTLNACNFRCAYCDNHQGDAYFDKPDPDRLDTAGGKRLLDVLITGSPALYWCGGEPTMREDLPELLAYAWDRGFFPNMINTNGSLLHRKLADEAWREFLWQMDVVIVSLDGLNEARLRTLWGVKRVERVFTNLLLLRELRRVVDFKLAVNAVIVPGSVEEARAVLDLADDLGIAFVPVPVNVKHGPNRDLLADGEYRALAEEIVRRKKAGANIIGSPALLQKLLFAEPYRCFTALKPHVWSDGSICWPCRASANTAPVDVNLLDYSSMDAAYRAGAARVNPSFFHGPAANQCGGECAWMQNYTTDRYVGGIERPLTGGLAREVYEFAFGGRSA